MKLRIVTLVSLHAGHQLASSFFLLFLFFFLILNIWLVYIGANICDDPKCCLIPRVAHHLKTTVHILDKCSNLTSTSVNALVVNSSELEASTFYERYSLANNIKGVEVAVGFLIILTSANEDLCGADRY